MITGQESMGNIYFLKCDCLTCSSIILYIYTYIYIHILCIYISHSNYSLTLSVPSLFYQILTYFIFINLW